MRRLNMASSGTALEIVQVLYSLEQLISKGRTELQSHQYHGLMEKVSEMRALLTDREPTYSEAYTPRVKSPLPGAAELLHDSSPHPSKSTFSPSAVRKQSPQSRMALYEITDSSRYRSQGSRTPESIRFSSPIRPRARFNSAEESALAKPGKSRASTKHTPTTPTTRTYTPRTHQDPRLPTMMIPPNLISSFDEDSDEIEHLSMAHRGPYVDRAECLAPTPMQQLGNWTTFSANVPASAIQDLSQALHHTALRDYDQNPRLIHVNRDRHVDSPRHKSESGSRHISKIKQIVAASPEGVPQISNHQPAGLPRLRVVSSSEPSPRPVSSSPRLSGSGLLMSPRSAFVPATSTEAPQNASV